MTLCCGHSQYAEQNSLNRPLTYWPIVFRSHVHVHGKCTFAAALVVQWMSILKEHIHQNHTHTHTPRRPLPCEPKRATHFMSSLEPRVLGVAVTIWHCNIGRIMLYIGRPNMGESLTDRHFGSDLKYGGKRSSASVGCFTAVPRANTNVYIWKTKLLLLNLNATLTSSLK